jgi:predicted nucleic acid-binding protein
VTLLLDTCVISEASKPRENVEIRRWLSEQQQGFLHISALTIGELCYGAGRLPDGKRKRELEDWLVTLREDFRGRILAVDEAVAERWGALRVIYPNASAIDSQLAATALVHGLTLVTRNVRDFRFPGLAVFNPWTK